MIKASKKYTKLLFVILLSMFVLNIGMNFVMVSFDLRDNITSIKSGTFKNVQQNIYDRSWVFSASEANGDNIIFVVDIDSTAVYDLSFKVNISSGEMIMLLEQEAMFQELDISTNMKITVEDIDMHMFESGLIDIRLIFVNARDVLVEANW